MNSSNIKTNKGVSLPDRDADQMHSFTHCNYENIKLRVSAGSVLTAQISNETENKIISNA